MRIIITYVDTPTKVIECLTAEIHDREHDCVLEIHDYGREHEQVPLWDVVKLEILL